MVEKPIILFLSSTSLHFPLDLHTLLVNEGHEAKRIDQIDELFSSPDRHRPYLAVLEIGSTDDLERAMLAAEWCEKIQPIAPCRLLLLVASKNIVLGDRAQRFGSAEVAYLPMPFKNLSFKVDLQKKLLTSEPGKAVPGKRSSTGFSTRFIEKPPSNERVLLARGPGPKKGFWQEAGESPQGKIRWRWVKTQEPEKKEEEEIAGISWVAESKAKPEYVESEEAWEIADPEAELLGFKKDNPVFSARAADAAQRAAVTNVIAVQSPSDRSTGKVILPEAAIAENEMKIQADATPSVKKQAEGKKEPREEITGKIIYSETPEGKTAAKENPESAKLAKTLPKLEIEKTSAPAAHTAKPDAASGQKPQTPEAPWNQSITPKPAPLTKAESAQPQLAALKKNPEATDPAIKIEMEKLKSQTNIEAPIPEKRHEEEETQDMTGFSVPVPTGGRTNISANAKALKDEIFSSNTAEIPKTEAEYLSQIERARAKIEEKTKQLLERKAALIASGAEKRASERAVMEKAPQLRETTLPSTHTQKTATPGIQVSIENSAAKPSESGMSFAPPVHNTAVTNLSAQERTAEIDTAKLTVEAEANSATVSANQTVQGNTEAAPSKITVEGDAGPAAANSNIEISGETPRSGEEIRIRAGVMAERAASAARKSSELENYLKYRHFVTMTLEELNDRDSSWHPVERYRIYLSAYQRYYGVKDPNALLPLWVYEGELAPEFLEEKQAWKFYDRYPELYSALDTLPPPVFDLVYRSAGIAPPKEGRRVSDSGSDSAKDWQKLRASGSSNGAEQDAKKENAPRRGVWGGVIGFFRRVFGRR